MTRDHLTGRRNSPILGLLVHLVVTLALAAGFIAVDLRQMPVQEATALVSTILMGLSVWLSASWLMATGSLFNPYGLFLLGSMPFHVGYAFLKVIGQESLVWLQGSTTEVQILQTLGYVTACYALLHLGALTVMAMAGREHAPAQWPDATRVYQVGWLMLALAIVPMLLKVRSSLDVVMTGGYSSLFEGGGRDPRTGAQGIIGLISEFYLPGVMFLLAGSRGRRLGQLVATLALLLFSGSYLFMGFRAFSLIPIAVFVWVWHRCVRPLPVFAVTTLGLGAFLVIAPLVRRIRDMSGMDRMSFEVLWEAYAGADNPLLALLAELAGSVLTISFTTELVPDVRPFEMGFGYFRALTNAVPMLHLPDAYGYAGSWLAWHVTPQLAVGGFGLGFSFMAESYLNFGWVGGAVFIGVIGAAVAGVQAWTERTGDPGRIAFLASFLPILIFFTRGESLSITRPILWYALIPYLMVLAFRAMDRRLVTHHRSPPSPDWASDRGTSPRVSPTSFPSTAPTEHA